MILNRNFWYLSLLIFALTLISSCKKEPELPEKIQLGDEVEIIEMETSFGTMIIWLYPETPQHYNNFLKLAKEEFYNDLLFHRIIPGFMIQGGDPAGNGTGGPGYTIPAEIIPGINHKRGSLAAARLGDQQNPKKASSGSQFYIAASTQGTSSLNGQYTVFGEVIKGIETVDEIIKQPKDQQDKPLTNITMQVRVLKKTRQEMKDEFGLEY